MADEEVPQLVLGAGSPKPAHVPPGILSGHMCILGTPLPSAVAVTEVSTWAAGLGAGTLIIDLDGHVAALLVERAARGELGDLDIRLLTPSSPVGVPVAFKPMSGLSSQSHTEAWKRVRAWVPQLIATLAGMGPGTPDHDRVANWFLGVLDRVKEDNPSMLTVQGLVSAMSEALSGEGSPLTPEVAEGLMAEMADLAEDLRNAALSYGAPVDLRRLLETPVAGPDAPVDPSERHIDIVLLSHMTQVADRNSTITAILLEVFAWTQISGDSGRLLVVLPEVESPASFLAKRPFAQRLTVRVLTTSKGTGLLSLVLPTTLEDPAGMPRFGAILMEKTYFDGDAVAVEGVLKDQGMSPEAWGRMGMLRPEEWALAAGIGWSKWHRFTPDPAVVHERELDSEALSRLLSPEVRDAFRFRPEAEEEEGEEGEEEDHDAREAAKAARAVEDAEDLLSYTTEKRPKRGDSRMHQEVQELLKRKLEEKERAKEAKRFELEEIDLVEGEEPTDMEMMAQTRRPLAEDVIDDHSGPVSEGTPGMKLHADDLQVELAVLEAREAEEERQRVREGGPDVVVDLNGAREGGWESVTPEVALGAGPEPTRGPRRDDEEDEEEEIIIEVDDEGS